MKRTQIYLDEEIFSILKRESETRHKTISEIVRNSIDDRYRADTYSLKKKLSTIFGIWRNRKLTPDAYIRNLRKDRKI